MAKIIPNGEAGGGPELIPVAAVAGRRGCGVRTIKREVERKNLAEPIIISNRWYFTLEDVAAYFAKLVARRGRGKFGQSGNGEPAV
jgi:hypothetical protein